jgi:hypothetical protein
VAATTSSKKVLRFFFVAPDVTIGTSFLDLSIDIRVEYVVLYTKSPALQAA